jgi:Ca-activated chloride channel homolog
MFTLKLRYKKPEESTSRLLEFPVLYQSIATQSPGKNFNMAVASATFAMRLREPNEKAYDFDTILRQVASAKGNDKFGYRSEFVNLVKNAAAIY